LNSDSLIRSKVLSILAVRTYAQMHINRKNKND